MRAAVLGQPILHSQSPKIHEYFARQFHLPLTYERIEQGIAPNLGDKLSTLLQSGYSYLNLTSPLKQETYKLCDEFTARAQLAQAVNIIKPTKHGIMGDYTDGVGVLQALCQSGYCASDNVWILGAGDVVPGIIQALQQFGCRAIWVSNRTIVKAQSLAARHDVTALPWGSVPQVEINWIINAVSAEALDWSFLHKASMGRKWSALDLKYGVAAQPFLAACHQVGVNSAQDGLYMLWCQAQAGFCFATGYSPKLPDCYI